MPDQYLGLSILAVAATGIIGVAGHASARRVPRDACTPAGRRALVRARRGHRRGTADPALQTALYGLDTVNDARFFHVRTSLRRRSVPAVGGGGVDDCDAVNSDVSDGRGWDGGGSGGGPDGGGPG